MQEKIFKSLVGAVENDSSIELQYKRLDYKSQKGLDHLAKKLLLGMKGTPLKFCVHCLVGKQRRVSFHSTPPSKMHNVLDLIHSDICGLMKIRILGGALYFVIFIDDRFKKLWAYTLKTKDQVLDIFKQFQARVEKEI